MTNTYSIDGDVVRLNVHGPKGIPLQCLIDLEDLSVVSSLPGEWFAQWQRTSKTYYVMGKCPDDFPGRKSSNFAFIHRTVMNPPKERDVDHLRHDGLDNRKEFLEIKTRLENMLNRRGVQANSTTGTLGVCPAKKRRRPGKGRPKSGFVGQLRVNGKKYCSSVRRTKEEASAWYWAKRRSLGIPDPQQRAA